MPEGDARLINFRTVSMSAGGAANLVHVVGWESSTGSLGDLSTVYTREQVSWDGAPAEFGMSGEYAGSGVHNGLGSNNATGGQTDDNHSIIPTGFKCPEDFNNGATSAVWTMKQEYQVKTADTDWQVIPGATYEISRWFDREGRTLVVHCHKQGTGSDTTSCDAEIRVPEYFPLVSKPELVEFSIDNVDRAVVDKWNEQALKELDEGDQTPFYEYEDLVIIVHPKSGGTQPYVDWASTQDWAVAGAYVKMVKKGGAFNPGSIKVVGARSSGSIEDAIGRVSKKKVEF